MSQKGTTFKTEVRKTCQICGNPLGFKKSKYCSKKCRQQGNNKRIRDRIKNDKEYKEKNNKRQREYLYKRSLKRNLPRIQCRICGKWFRQVGTHITQVHGLTAREYREEYGFDVKRGQLPEDLREIKADHVFTNGTVENLKAGEKHWFKKEQKGCGVYKRSDQTIKRLKSNCFKKK